MKKVISILVLTLFSGMISLVYAQDVITLTKEKDGREIRGKVTEIGINEIKYTDTNGQSLSIPKADVFRIQFENGPVQVINVPGQTATPQTPVDNKNKPPFETPSGTPVKASGSTQNTGVISSSSSFSSSNYKRGYVGIGFGPAILMEEYNDTESTGIQFNINVGYLFSKRVGITASYLVTSYDVKGADDVTIGLRGFLVGPLFTFEPASPKIEIDIRPMVGYIQGKLSGNNVSLKTKSTFGAGLGASVRFNLIDYLSISANLDSVFHGDLSDNPDGLSIQSYASTAITFGVNFRF
jgi:hypothetical protein